MHTNAVQPKSNTTFQATAAPIKPKTPSASQSTLGPHAKSSKSDVTWTHWIVNGLKAFGRLFLKVISCSWLKSNKNPPVDKKPQEPQKTSLKPQPGKDPTTPKLPRKVSFHLPNDTHSHPAGNDPQKSVSPTSSATPAKTADKPKLTIHSFGPIKRKKEPEILSTLPRIKRVDWAAEVERLGKLAWNGNPRRTIPKVVPDQFNAIRQDLAKLLDTPGARLTIEAQWKIFNTNPTSLETANVFAFAVLPALVRQFLPQDPLFKMFHNRATPSQPEFLEALSAAQVPQPSAAQGSVAHGLSLQETPADDVQTKEPLVDEESFDAAWDLHIANVKANKKFEKDVEDIREREKILRDGLTFLETTVADLNKGKTKIVQTDEFRRAHADLTEFVSRLEQLAATEAEVQEEIAALSRQIAPELDKYNATRGQISEEAHATLRHSIFLMLLQAAQLHEEYVQVRTQRLILAKLAQSAHATALEQCPARLTNTLHAPQVPSKPSPRAALTL